MVHMQNDIISHDSENVITHRCRTCGIDTGKVVPEFARTCTESASSYWIPVTCQRGHDAYVHITPTPAPEVDRSPYTLECTNCGDVWSDMDEDAECPRCGSGHTRSHDIPTPAPEEEPIIRCMFRIYSKDGHAPHDIVQYARHSEAGAYCRQWDKAEGYARHMEYVGPADAACKTCYDWGDYRSDDGTLHTRDCQSTPDQTIERASTIVARLRLKTIGIATAALLALSVTSTSAQTACYDAGVTGEGFPAITCTNGSTHYQDLDGDGRDPSTNGRWVETDPAWIVK